MSVRSFLLQCTAGTTLLVVFALCNNFVEIPFVHADDELIEELRDEIAEKEERIGDIQKEINEYRQELQGVTAEKTTLQNAIRQLDISRQQVGAEIRLTEKRIDAALGTIESLTEDIREHEQKIRLNTNAIGKTVRELNDIESQTLVEVVLANDQLSDVWGRVADLQQLQTAMHDSVRELEVFKEVLENRRNRLEAERQNLSGFRTELTGKQQAIDVNKAEKDDLLQVTQSEESRYQSLIAEKQAQIRVFEQELLQLEERIREFTVNPDALPDARPGVLAWPVADPYLTQTFGNTSFATQNAQIYNGSGHNGIDLRAPIGTTIRAALSGQIAATGNTDAEPGCFSYGKWVLIRHNNGLATLYAHLSSINVSQGQTVSTGDIIGFSGATGIVTGPHLHFTVYAGNGVAVQPFATSRGCKNVSIPIATGGFSSYLNPLSYLPRL